MKKEILEILEKADKRDTNIPPTLLYNEGWMLRTVLQQIKEKRINHPDLTFTDDGINWYSEALLPTPFSARMKGDKLCETRTHADGVVGKFNIEKKGDLILNDLCNFFYVIEAKMYSKLSTGTKNAKNFNQAARTVACIAQLIYNKQKPVQIYYFKKLAFYVLLPEEQIKNEPTFKEFTDKENIKHTIISRMSLYPLNDNNKKGIFDWLDVNLDNYITKIDIKLITWEDLIENSRDSTLEEFYDKCKHFNKK